MKRGLTLRKNNRHEYTVWQRRFWEHTIRDENDFASHVDYIHYNPVKHRLIQTASEWPFSSIHTYIKQGILTHDWAGTSFESGFGEINE